MATHSSVLAWRIPGMGEPGGLPSMGSHRVGHDWSDLAAAAAAHCWWECTLVQPLWKRVLRVLKVKNRTTVWSNNHTPGCAAQENKNAILKRYVHPNVHKYFVYKSQDMQATYISINRVNNKWCICTMEYHFAVKKKFCHLQQYGQTCRVLWLEK